MTTAGIVRTLCHLELYTVRFIWGWMWKLAVTDSISAGKDIPQDVRLLFVLILSSLFIPAVHNSGYTSARGEWIQIEHTDRCSIFCPNCWDTAVRTTPGSPLQWHRYIHRRYDPGYTSNNSLNNWRLGQIVTPCDMMWVNPYWGRGPSTNIIIYTDNT